MANAMRVPGTTRRLAKPSAPSWEVQGKAEGGGPMKVVRRVLLTLPVGLLHFHHSVKMDGWNARRRCCVLPRALM